MLESHGKKILSPVNGVASLTPDKQYFQIKQDGSWSTVAPYHPAKYDRNSLFATLDQGGLYSLDLNQTALAEYFKSFDPNKNFSIVLSPFSRIQHLDFRELIFRDMKEAFGELVSLIGLIFPKATISNFFLDEKLVYEHPIGFPEYFLHKQMEMTVESAIQSIVSCNTLYLGAETIYHILRMLYFGEPFTKRHLSVFLVDKKGRMDIEPRQYYLTNGQSLAFILNNLETKYKVASFESVFDSIEPVDVNSLGYFNIYEQYSLTLYEKLPVVRKSFSCIDCNECNLYCPTNANPFSLVKNRLEEFAKNQCIVCGICTVYCPSGIDIRTKILETKGF
ncbi:4Fe-4S dicluster domain-containing protein [Leptospira sp. 96542]|nr:4Fe-4S dicluster domain-containing protein [Leptospira sp. 96542]